MDIWNPSTAADIKDEKANILIPTNHVQDKKKRKIPSGDIINILPAESFTQLAYSETALLYSSFRVRISTS